MVKYKELSKLENNHPDMTEDMKRELRNFTLRQKRADIKFRNNSVRLDPDMIDNCSGDDEDMELSIPSLPKLDEPTILPKQDRAVINQMIYYDKDILENELRVKFGWMEEELLRIWMYVTEGFTQGEIAGLEGKPVLWVNRRIKKIRKLVKENQN